MNIFDVTVPAHDHHTMRTYFALAGLLAYFASLVSATALTYKLDAHERACFFTQVQHKGTKVAFYFAVRMLGGSCSRIGLVNLPDYIYLQDPQEGMVDGI